ncbi:MAG: hypothetical protein HKM04_11320 [Legionellales bacterium]|nr:hypothetical protein [Legionellales bacterium]
MDKIRISITDQLASRMRSVISSRQSNKIIMRLIEKEIERRERLLYDCAVSVERDEALRTEMEDWDTDFARPQEVE